jgi:hypothetical protein
VRRAARESFDADRARACAEIKEVRSINTKRKNLEESFAQAASGGPHTL